jgi:DNA-binding NarL/FixJ family response regulator
MHHVRILIADDHDVIRRMVREVLQTRPDFEVIGEATNGIDAVEQSRMLKPDVVLLNIVMPTLNGFDAAREINKTAPNSAIVILSTHKNEQFIEEAQRIAIDGYVEKSEAGHELTKAIDAALTDKSSFLVE